MPYILIPLMMVIGIAIASQQSGNRSAEAKYYQIVQYFDKDQVSEFTLNLTSGTLKYKLKGDDTKWQYKVPNVSVFVDDINETVREHNKNAKSEDDMIKYELISGSSTSWFVNLLPTIIMGVLLVILLVIMMRRMNAMGGFNPRPLISQAADMILSALKPLKCIRAQTVSAIPRTETPFAIMIPKKSSADFLFPRLLLRLIIKAQR